MFLFLICKGKGWARCGGRCEAAGEVASNGRLGIAVDGIVTFLVNANFLFTKMFGAGAVRCNRRADVRALLPKYQFGNDLMRLSA